MRQSNRQIGLQIKVLTTMKRLHYNPFGKFARENQIAKVTLINSDCYRPVFNMNNIYDITPHGITVRDTMLEHLKTLY